ncbi:protein PSK SIMULATOR 1-like isoform X1 [Typha latifolia]|uniref:protein PSK SIMULATOR 1-like isoform X1 n=1 Tax=Typha latifolia TaxID=4733 RepID=UPI003C2C16DC
MGCVWSKRREDKGSSPVLEDEPEVGLAVVNRRSVYGGYDSGELAIKPAKVGAGAGKLSETSSILGRAGMAGLEKAVEVLDTLGSSMSSFNQGSGFISGMTARGNKVSILSFEVANTIAKAATLWRSFSDENIKFLKEEILQSDGVRILVSSDNNELLRIAAADKRDEVAVFSREVIRFGDLSKNPIWHNLGRYFQKFNADPTPQEQSKEEIEATVQHLINLAQNTSELYHELHALDRFEQDFRRKFQEEESLPAARRAESLVILHSELKRQRKLVKSLKKKSLWSRNLEEVVEKLVDIVIFLHKQIAQAFTNAGTNPTGYEPVQDNHLGPCGLALHYANIINQIDNIVSRPLSLPPSTRENLYHGLPTAVKSALRSRLQSSNGKEEYTVSQIKAEMQKTLRWIVPIAENTIRAHQGFGWVGEWASIGTDINKKPAQQSNITRIQTLHHADKEKTEQYILELVVWLHHLVVQVKSRGYGLNSLQVSLRSNAETATPNETKEDSSLQSNGKDSTFPQISEEEREMLESLSSKKIIYRRSKSLESTSMKETRAKRKSDLSLSLGNSPAKEFSSALDLHTEKRRILDIMDGLDTLLNSYSIPFC